MHWARNCSHAYENRRDDNQLEEVHITLMLTAYTKSDRLDILLGETLGCVLLDTGCTKTVCGQIWFECFLDSFSCEKDRKLRLRNLTLFINLEMI